MSLAEWSWRRVATVSAAWVIGFPPLALATLFTRAALLDPAPSPVPVVGTGTLKVVFEYPSPTATLLSIFWLGPPVLLLGIWLLTRDGSDNSGAA